ncbi:hypothetical protein OG874_00460 [Nocardia sp. NBC_00565]|uniref:hypothetical protein n=1 Tax=Nocardia sp. NBC_00565 TaxID=2975993 RepID=UPI002E808ECF|nr:hypothetical protein [Nocardia sp. NBC_00565]WUC03727.1 hypothetical protein OG874_00460 [Nocardia sp. NBC_00565]
MPDFATGGLIERGTGERGDIIPTSLTGCSFRTSAARLSPNAQAFMLAAINAGVEAAEKP